MDKLKAHVKKHKVLYSCVGGGILSAGITYLIMRKARCEGLGYARPYGLETADTPVTTRALSFLSCLKNSQNSIVNVIAREGRGHPGYLIHCLELDTWFYSQREASKVFDISETVLSKHLNGLLENASGYHFERISIAA